MIYLKLFLGWLGMFLFLTEIDAQKGVFIGGKLGTPIPLNLFAGEDNIGFANVASPGVLVGVEGRWMYEKRLSLGAELNYQYNPAKQNFWDVGRRGDVTAHYQTVSLLFRGDYYFSHKEVRPYTGVAFGGFFMFNDLMFASTLPEYIDDESVSYTTTLWKPGFAPEGGVVFRLNRKIFLDLNFKFIFIPNIEPEYETEIINGWPVVINKNPHANQHHLQLSATLLFGI